MAEVTKKREETKVVDKELGIDYNYLLDRTSFDTVVVSQEEIAQEDTELMRAFLEANADVKTYIDKAIFDPKGEMAKHIINLLKDKNYKISIGKSKKEYRLAEAIMIMAMSACYKYVEGVAQALAEKSGNKNCIQLADNDVYTIAENFFKHGGLKATISIETPKKETPKTSAKKSTGKSATEVKTADKPTDKAEETKSVTTPIVADTKANEVATQATQTTEVENTADDMPYEIVDETPMETTANASVTPISEDTTPKAEQLSFDSFFGF